MKLAFLSNKDPSLPYIDSDGGAVTVRYYAAELSRRGHLVDIFTPEITKKYAHDSYLQRKAHAQKNPLDDLVGEAKVHRKRIRSANRSLLQERDAKNLAGIVDSYLFADALPKRGLEEYDVVSIFHPLAGFGVMNRQLVDPNKTVLFPMLLSDFYMKYEHVSQMYRDLELSLLQQVGTITSPSQDEANTAIKRGISPEKIRIVHRGIDKKIFFPEEKPKGFNPYERISITCTNAIRPQKGQHHLILTAKLLKQKGMNVEVNFAGEHEHPYKPEHNDYYQNLLALAERNGVAKNVRFLGSLSPQEVSALLRSSDIAVFPSEAESFGKSPLEAIASGTPTIVGSDVPAYTEFVNEGENALSVERSPRKIAEAVTLLATDEDLYLRLSREGTKLSREFSWENVSLDLENLYKDIMENS
ncbi:MAG: glycosyltransferase family 4 protein [Nanoarchaeota archaeon]